MLEDVFSKPEIHLQIGPLVAYCWGDMRSAFFFEGSAGKGRFPAALYTISKCLHNTLYVRL